MNREVAGDLEAKTHSVPANPEHRHGNQLSGAASGITNDHRFAMLS
jgi:hypothetical protein